jgi:hypothetical protein
VIRAALVLRFISTAGFAQTYSVVPIPPPSGTNAFVMTAINNLGQVAGNVVQNGFVSQPFIATASGVTMVPLPNGWSSAYAVAINNLGQVTGYIPSSAPSQAFIGSAAASVPIPFPSGSSSAFGVGINDSGQVAGYAYYGSVFNDRAFIGTASGTTLIPLPNGWSTMTAAAINKSGQVTGDSGIAQPYIGSTSGTTPIPSPGGWSGPLVLAINDSGVVAGYGGPSPSATNQAFVSSLSGTTAIPLPIGATTATVTIGSLSNSGVVVGQSDAGGWVWDAKNGTRLLNSMMPSGWKVLSPLCISNNGLILAWASYQGGAQQVVELISAALPTTPAPSTLSLILIGVALCSVWWAHHRRTKPSSTQV